VSVMKINDVNRIGAVNPYRNHTPSGNASSVGGKGKKDQVQISEEAMKLLESQGAAAVDPARIKQIEELKNAVSTGTYTVDAGKVADKLLPYLNI
jgi:negative regulator of flagellin synthesis FlgM